MEESMSFTLDRSLVISSAEGVDCEFYELQYHNVSPISDRKESLLVWQAKLSLMQLEPN